RAVNSACQASEIFGRLDARKRIWIGGGLFPSGSWLVSDPPLNNKGGKREGTIHELTQSSQNHNLALCHTRAGLLWAVAFCPCSCARARRRLCRRQHR